ncbi:MAG: protein convertase [Legionella sp.]|nr:MAG: protein convertase [Legionella sp.]
MTSKSEKQIVIDWLIDQFPNAFFHKSHLVKPLKLGVFEDIMDVYERLDDPPFSKKLLREALNYYTASKSYLACQKPNTMRLDLFGQPNGVVNEEQAAYAQKRYQDRYMQERQTNT